MMHLCGLHLYFTGGSELTEDASCLEQSQTQRAQPPMIADDLRRQADVSIDLSELQPKIRRDPAPREPR